MSEAAKGSDAAMPVLYGIRNCDSVKAARAWLARRGIDHRFHDYGKDGVPAEALARWLAALGRDALVNRRGTTWRRLAEAERASLVDDASALALLRAHPSLIRRPLLAAADGSLAAGFDEARWSGLLG